jgi:hypothetical protein
LGKPGLPPTGHLPVEKYDIPVPENLEQSLGNPGTGAKLAGHYQLGIPVGRYAIQP